MFDDILRKGVALQSRTILFREESEDSIAVRRELELASVHLGVAWYDAHASTRARGRKSVFVEFTELELPEVCSVDSDNGIWISTSATTRMAGASGYTYAQGITLGILSGLPVVRVLKNLRVFRVEDLIHDNECGCVLAKNSILSNPRSRLFLCEGSVDFYNQLHAAQEMQNIQTYINYLRSI
jgi:hypothetical protein